jgi:hypothetical protein
MPAGHLALSVLSLCRDDLVQNTAMGFGDGCFGQFQQQIGAFFNLDFIG